MTTSPNTALSNNQPQQLDTRGLTCPLPILRTKKALAEMAAGEVLWVVSTDPGSVQDFEAFAEQTGNLLLESTQRDGEFHFKLQKT